MEFVFWSKDLHILRTVRCKIFDGPRSQNGVLILKKRWMRTMLYRLQNGTEIHVTLLLITLILHKTFKNCLFFIRWMISILYTIHNLYRKCIIIHHINILQNLQNLFILLKKCHFKFINNMLSFQLMIIVLTEAPLST